MNHDASEVFEGVLAILILTLVYIVYPPLFWAYIIFVVIVVSVFCHYLFKQWDADIEAKKRKPAPPTPTQGE
jgi:glucan phosphoethanolaminetransferase (alkaline phosphatase superfamily)